MKNKIIAFLFVLTLSGMQVMADNEGQTIAEKATSPEVATIARTITGKVYDLSTGEVLAGAEVIIEGTEVKTYSDLDGNFTITALQPGKYNIICSLISYNKSLVEDINTTEAANSCKIALEPSR
ncbi:MAG TPA: hypothetical protein DEO70_11945 [Bacteroidales bacterium]|nr:MAG: hypothetical protein A2X11_09935 [Bacteroidetes bacterium GWE2_42_24]OFY26185.1 MAG: hypothetical protein A2X09_05205 [Bacteroidetes bacterium GWF2_43_11]PKP16830.1 MAG: hypothetical protein CVU06_13940 [Bacteroidetes bacterium HGW-Bacteroidetes-22]HBZ67539.1 hypothetical protein [Bacteroidales bacterium]